MDLDLFRCLRLIFCVCSFSFAIMIPTTEGKTLSSTFLDGGDQRLASAHYVMKGSDAAVEVKSQNSLDVDADARKYRKNNYKPTRWMCTLQPTIGSPRHPKEHGRQNEVRSGILVRQSSILCAIQKHIAQLGSTSYRTRRDARVSQPTQKNNTFDPPNPATAANKSEALVPNAKEGTPPSASTSNRTGVNWDKLINTTSTSSQVNVQKFLVFIHCNFPLTA